MLAHAINERMAHRVEYLQEEVRVLEESMYRGALSGWLVAFVGRSAPPAGRAMTHAAVVVFIRTPQAADFSESDTSGGRKPAS